jgi:hypothetical protein
MTPATGHPRTDRPRAARPRTEQARADRQVRRAATLDDPAFERFRTPRARRLLVGALAGLLVVESVAVLVVDHLHPAVALGLLVALVIGLVTVIGTLKAATRGVEERAPGTLDERQLHVRGAAYRRSYTLLGWLAVVAVSVLLAATSSWWDAPRAVPLLVGVLTIQLALVLPAVVTALGEDV